MNYWRNEVGVWAVLDGKLLLQWKARANCLSCGCQLSYLQLYPWNSFSDSVDSTLFSCSPPKTRQEIRKKVWISTIIRTQQIQALLSCRAFYALQHMLWVISLNSWKTREMRNFHFWVTDSEVEMVEISATLHGLEKIFTPKDWQEKVLRLIFSECLEFFKKRLRKVKILPWSKQNPLLFKWR